MVELANRAKLRVGENPAKPYGGTATEQPFALLLSRLMKTHGFEKQQSLSDVLGHDKSTIVCGWISRGILPDLSTLPTLTNVLQLDFDEAREVYNTYLQAYVAARNATNRYPLTLDFEIPTTKRLALYSSADVERIFDLPERQVRNLRRRLGITLPIITEEQMIKLTLEAHKTISSKMTVKNKVF